jgi:hypothetical protein
LLRKKKSKYFFWKISKKARRARINCSKLLIYKGKVTPRFTPRFVFTPRNSRSKPISLREGGRIFL